MILTGAEQRKDVELVAQTIIDALAMPFHMGQQRIQISVSIGIAFYPGAASSPDALLEAADQAMYQAKKAGSNQMCFYDTFDKTGADAANVCLHSEFASPSTALDTHNAAD